MAAIVASSDEMTFDEYLVAYDGVHAEWAGGRAVPQDAEGAQHSRLKRFLETLMQVWAEEHDAGEVYLAPFTVRLGASVAREPDVFFVSRNHGDRVLPTHVEGAPDLVVKVAGPGSRVAARSEKRVDYEAAGIPEYWLIDPDRKVVEAWRLGSNRWYEAVPLGNHRCCEARHSPACGSQRSGCGGTVCRESTKS